MCSPILAQGCAFAIVPFRKKVVMSFNSLRDLGLLSISAVFRFLANFTAEAQSTPRGAEKKPNCITTQGRRLVVGAVRYNDPLHQLGRFAEAIQEYQIAIGQKTDYALAHYNLGMSYVAMGNRDAALAQYRILQRIDDTRAKRLFN